MGPHPGHDLGPPRRIHHLDPQPAGPAPCARRDRADLRVGLVSMPFVAHYRPSIQLGLLKAITSAAGFTADTFHLGLDFARQIGPARYESICDDGRNFGLGEWLFSPAAFGKAAPDHDQRLLAQYPEYTERLLAEWGTPAEFLCTMRDHEVPAYLDRVVTTVAWHEFDVIGFTSTFQQNTASFALATRIKAEFPEVTLLFGGANFDGEMGVELVRTIPCIDYAIIGEADHALPEFLTTLHEGRDPAEVPGVACRRDGVVADPHSRPLLRQLDELPLPDYDEFFTRAAALELLDGSPYPVEIPFESARGCWWGQRHHCTFCGLNGTGMAFRAKSPDRVRDELRQAADRYRTRRFTATDNILDASYLRTLLPALVEDDAGYDLFYELKANLTRAQIELLADAGVRRIQPGIESLSSRVLALMRKGTSALQNVNTLRWARHYGIDVTWNILHGFPGETAEDYRAQDRTIAAITHLQPPNAFGRILMERFSPIFADRVAFPARYRRPRASYRYVYPADVDLDRVAYTFDYEFDTALPTSELRATRALVENWQAAWRTPTRPSLTFEPAGDALVISDLREPARPTEFTVAEPLASLYAALSDRPRNVAKIAAELGLLEPVEELTVALDEFCAQGLMVGEDHAFLSLALPSRWAP